MGVNRRRRGMTLVELLVAAALGVGIMLMLYGSMASSTRRFRTGEAGLEANLEVQRILEYLRKDINGDYTWGACDAPKEVLEATRFGDGMTMALAPRFIEHRFEYYRNFRGPTGEQTVHQGSPKRIRTPAPVPCPVSFDVDASRWLDNPRTDKHTRGYKVNHFAAEAVMPGDRTRSVWILGPAYWIFDLKRGLLLRYTEAAGMTEFGQGRVLSAKMLPVMEHSWNEIRTPEGTFISIRNEKKYLSVALTLDREEERTPLGVETKVLYTGN